MKKFIYTLGFFIQQKFDELYDDDLTKTIGLMIILIYLCFGFVFGLLFYFSSIQELMPILPILFISLYTCTIPTLIFLIILIALIIKKIIFWLCDNWKLASNRAEQKIKKENGT